MDRGTLTLTRREMLVGLAAIGALTLVPAGYPRGAAAQDAVRGMTVNAYFPRGEKLHTVHRQIVIPEDKRVATVALLHLLTGPTPAEAELGFVTTIPSGTLLRGIALDANTGVATLDFNDEYQSGGGSLSMALRLAQVVVTATQFPTISAVSFLLNGEPVEAFGGEGIMIDDPAGRDRFEEHLPAILTETPAPFDVVSSTVRATGSSNTFEATSFIDITTGDGPLVEQFLVTATSGTGTRGTFDVEVPLPAGASGPATFTSYELSARDGSRINETSIPITIEAR